MPDYRHASGKKISENLGRLIGLNILLIPYPLPPLVILPG